MEVSSRPLRSWRGTGRATLLSFVAFIGCRTSPSSPHEGGESRKLDDDARLVAGPYLDFVLGMKFARPVGEVRNIPESARTIEYGGIVAPFSPQIVRDDSARPALLNEWTFAESGLQGMFTDSVGARTFLDASFNTSYFGIGALGAEINDDKVDDGFPFDDGAYWVSYSPMFLVAAHAELIVSPGERDYLLGCRAREYNLTTSIGNTNRDHKAKDARHHLADVRELGVYLGFAEEASTLRFGVVWTSLDTEDDQLEIADATPAWFFAYTLAL